MAQSGDRDDSDSAFYDELARRWLASGRARGFLLRPPLLEAAERWVAAQPAGTVPISEIQSFVTESRRALARLRYVLTATLLAGLVMAVGLAGVAFWQRTIATECNNARTDLDQVFKVTYWPGTDL